MNDKIKLKITFNQGFLEDIKTTLYVQNLQTDDPSHYHHLVLMKLAKMKVRKVDLKKIEILE